MLPLDPLTAAIIAIEDHTEELRGPEGKAGLDGRQGPPGVDGADGAIGPIGPVGPIGPKGDTGPKGEKGEKGDKGDPGKSGPAGASGGRARGLASGMVIDNAGTPLNSGRLVGEVDFTGAGVSTAITGGKVVVTIPGGGGGSDDQTAAEVPFTPAGSIAATNVQAAIEEVAAEASGLPIPVQSGSGTPYLVVTPTQVGALYIDVDSGAFYSAIGETSADWFSNAGNGDRSAPGFFAGPTPTGSMNILGLVTQGVEISDTTAYAGTGNGIQWHNPDGVDGSQRFQIAVGEVGGYYWRIGVINGDPADGGLAFVTPASSGLPVFRVHPSGAVASADSLGLFGVTPPVQQTVADISDPTIATPETNALKINELLGALRAYGLLA